jgi:hypothetical protein
MSGALFYNTLVTALPLNTTVTVLMTIACAGLLHGLYLEKDLLYAGGGPAGFAIADLKAFLAVVVGSLVSYYLNVTLGLGAVLGASLVGLVGAVVAPAYGPPLYCGSFVGMASPTVLRFPAFLLAIVGAGIIYVLAQDVFNGYGGKLGTIACAGCCLASLVSGSTFLSSPVSSWEGAWPSILVATAAAVLSYVINVRLACGGVMGSALVGVVGGIVLPALVPSEGIPGIGVTLATACLCGSFTGMSGKNRISHVALMALAGSLTGLVFVYSAPAMAGAGGKLGTTAFGSAIAVSALTRVFSKLVKPS